MGVVYLVRDVRLNRRCALKMILSGAHSGDSEIERFRTEAQAIARLQHPDIVQVFEIGEHEGRPFMALEYCSGGPLDAVLPRNPLAPRVAAKLVRTLAQAMQAAHEANVIHRDLKPANVLVASESSASGPREGAVPSDSTSGSRTGAVSGDQASGLREGAVSSAAERNNRGLTAPARLVPKITDFGLAKNLDEQGDTRTGAIMGTPSYMPPEQADGKKDIGPAADIYALGAILYECLGDRPSFRAATALDTILQVLSQEPAPLRQLNPKVPTDLETIAHKCLQKDPIRRYATARDLADDGPLSGGRTGPGPRPPRPNRTSAWPMSKRLKKPGLAKKPSRKPSVPRPRGLGPTTRLLRGWPVSAQRSGFPLNRVASEVRACFTIVSARRPGETADHSSEEPSDMNDPTVQISPPSQPLEEAATVGISPDSPGSSDPEATLDGEFRPVEGSAGSADIPGYEFLGELGRGGMGVVYKARHRQLNRLCALKMVLAGRHADEQQRQRFLAEARAVAALQHAHIVQVFEIGQHGELPYFSLEFVAGGTLTDRVRDNPLPAREAAGVVEHLAHAVAYAHAHGIVHRDLKPDNVLMTETGEPKVTDFGLAKQTQSNSNLTASGAIVGTPSYMAPEQAEGKKEVGPPADIYALGAILYRLVTGRPPFQAATTMETILQVMRDEPVPPGQLVRKLPRDLETIILTCLRKEPSRRYASAEALAEDLKRFLADEPIQARPVGKIERAWRWCRKKPLAAALVALVGLMLTAAVIVPVVIAAREANAAQTLALEKDRTQLALKESRENERKANEAVEQVRAAEKEKTEKLWQSYLDQARAGRVSSRVGQRFDSLATLAEAARIRPDLRLRNEAIACLALQDIRRAGNPFVVPATEVHRSPSMVQRAVCPVSGNVATQAADDRVVEVHSPGGQLLYSLTHATRVEHLYWRRDGGMLAAAVVPGPIHLWRTPEAKRQAVLEGHQSGVVTMEFSPDDRWLLTTSYDNTARLWRRRGWPTGVTFRAAGFSRPVQQRRCSAPERKRSG